MLKYNRGFTIVEITVVIVVIGILSTIIVISYSGYQTRAKAAQMAAALDTVDKALESYAHDRNWLVWPRSGDVVSGYTFNADPNISELVNQLPGFNTYINNAPTLNNISLTDFRYDSDRTDPVAKDIITCSASSNDITIFYGTNLIIRNVDATVAAEIDRNLDDGNTLCGRIRVSTYFGLNELVYTLSRDDTIE